MKTKYLNLALVLLIFSCTTEVEISNYFDSNKSIYIVNRLKSPNVDNLHEIQSGEIKHKKLVSWIDSNYKNWKTTADSGDSELGIVQESFKLFIDKEMNAVRMIFVDETGFVRQYTNSIKHDELNFLSD